MNESDIGNVLNAAPVSLMVLDPQLTILAATDEYVSSVMVRREDIIGKRVIEAFPDNPADPDRVLGHSLKTVLLTGRPHSVPLQAYELPEESHVESGSRTRYWSVINTPLLDEDGKIEYVLHRCDDVTEFVELAAASDATPEQSRLTLIQAAILQRSSELQETNNLLRASDMAKNEFLSRMSHELRTPLNAIIGFSQLLQLSALAEKDQGSVSHILKAGWHLLALINDVLDLSGIESGHVNLSLEPVDVGEVLDEVVNLLRPAAMSREVTLESMDGHRFFVEADRQRVKQILLNLGSNAIKYNSDGGTVRLLVVAEHNSLVRVGVLDTGPGIAQERLGRLFTPFDRLGAEHSTIEGTGLGLALSRTLAEAMGGSIDVESELGKGTTFWVDLKRVQMPDPLPSVVVEAPGVEFHGSGTLLYVEDNLANIQLLERVVATYESIELLTAMQGGLAIDFARSHLPKLILLDLNLPDISGDVVLARLKADPITRDIPVAVVSADANRHQIERLLQAGAETYLTKPFDLRDLMAIISRHMVDDYAEKTS